MNRILNIIGDNHEKKIYVERTKYKVSVYSRDGEVRVQMAGLDLPLSSGSDEQIDEVITKFEVMWYKAYVSQVAQSNYNADEYASDYANETCGINELAEDISYPFDEGDDYWTIEDGEVIWSCWDDQSEELHDDDPGKIYFDSEQDAKDSLK
jgi:hypothetical protein